MLRSMRPIRHPRLWLPVALALSLGACATQTLEERLSYLQVLKSSGTISEEEHAILRRRLVETIDLSALRPPPDPAPPSAEPERPPPLSVDWVIGSWSGSHTGSGSWHWDVVTTVEFSRVGEELEWTMTRQFRSTTGLSVARASGTAVVREDRLVMMGLYVEGSSMVTDGTPVEYTLERAGVDLEGFAGGADPRTRMLILHRVRR